MGNCLEVMKGIEDKSIDMILCDLPYGTTACSWDTIIPFEPLWTQYKRIIKDNGAIVLTASQPFTSKLVMSNLGMFKYEWIWEKAGVTGFANAKKQPLRCYEDVLIFCKKATNYNPVGLRRANSIKKNGASVGGEALRTNTNSDKGKGRLRTAGASYVQEWTNYPKQIIKGFDTKDNHHPTQKPVALFEYLIKTYTSEGDTVLDNCAGSGTTAIACIKNNRNYILIEKEAKYIEIINKRIKEELSQGDMFRTVKYD
jgi:site-specific DNA-methyltransferase (adenine-specific)